LKASAELSDPLDQTLTELRAIEPAVSGARLRDLAIRIGIAGIGKAAKTPG